MAYGRQPKYRKVHQHGTDMHARKSMGQHFLNNEGIIQDIVAALPIKVQAQVLEIGPGPGALTSLLLAIPEIDFKCIELDFEKVAFLEQTFPQLKDKIIQGDFLKKDPPFEGDFEIIGNFPYNISTQIIFKVLDWRTQVNSCVGMFQKEVAQRIAAKHGNKNYGIQSVLTQIFYDVEYLFDVAAEHFIPPPNVVSGVIRLVRNNNPYKVENYEHFKSFVKIAFSQRRKTLRNCFKSYLAEEQLKDEIFNKRCEQLSVADFVAFYNQLWLNK
jgi:16S rRNA (adenine1518-N6/adenine1519-N6)-dimethyltransferase